MSLQNHSLISLFRIGNSIHNLNKQAEEKMGLSLVQWCLLKQLINMPGTSAYRLAKAVGIHPSTLTQTLKRLEKKGYVYQNEDPSDSRKKTISLTQAGKTTMDKIAFFMDQWSQELQSIEQDIKNVHSTLQRQAEGDIWGP